MKKIIRNAAIAVTVVSAVSMSEIVNNTVRADNVTSTHEQSQTDANRVQANVDTAKQNLNLANNKVKESQAKVDTATRDNQAANEDVARKAQAVKNAQVALNQAKSEQTVSENNVKDAQNATPAIDSVDIKAEVADKTNQLNELKKQQTQAVTDLADTKANQVKQLAQNDKAQNELAKSQATYSDAEKQVNNLQTSLDANKVDNLSKDKEQAEVKINKLQAELNEANNANETKAQAVEVATKKVNKATSEFNQTKDSLVKSQVELAKAQANLKELGNSRDALNVIKIPQGYTIEGLKVASKDGNEKFKQISKSGIGLNEKFKSSQADENEKVDYQHLTDEQLVEINKYAVGLVNQVREHFGLKDLILNADGLEITKMIADGYRAKNESILKGDWHDLELLDNRPENIAASTVYDTIRTNIPAMKVKSAKDISYDESNSTYRSILTMADLKADIYAGILGMFFDDMGSHYGHALNFLAEHKYIAVAPSVIDGMIVNYGHFGNAYINYLDWHFIFPGYVTWQDGNYSYSSGNPNDKIDSTRNIALNSNVDTSAAEKVVAEKQAAYTAAKSKNDKATIALATAQEELSKANGIVVPDVAGIEVKLVQEKRKLADINNKIVKINPNTVTLEQELQAATSVKSTALKDLQAKQANATKVYNDLAVANARVIAAQETVANLDRQTLAVKEELVALNKLREKFEKAKEKVAYLQTQVKAARENVSKTQKNLANAKEKLELAKANASETAQTLAVAQAELNLAKSEQKTALESYNKAINELKIFQAVDNSITKQAGENTAAQQGKVAQGNEAIQKDKPVQENTAAQQDKVAQGNEATQKDKPVQENTTVQQDKVVQEKVVVQKDKPTPIGTVNADESVSEFKKQSNSLNKVSVLSVKELPHTGSNEENLSVWGVMLLVLSSLLTLFGYDKQKKNC